MESNLTNNQVLIKECVEQEYKESTGYCSINAYFEHFSVAQVLKKYNLSDEEIDNGNTGGGNDAGCDNMYIFLNGELVTCDQLDTLPATRGSLLEFCIIQSKYAHSFGEDAIMKWKTVSENLLDISVSSDPYDKRYNEATLETFRLFGDIIKKLVQCKVKISFHYYYVTMANQVHPNVIQQADELKEIVKGKFPSSAVDIHFIDANDLMCLYNTDSEIRVSLNLTDQPISLNKNDYVALVNIGTYFNFITDEDHNLRKNFFESNVRDYQGHNAVNSQIAETLEHEKKGDFWWLNNGVTILASELTLITNKSLQLVNPEIVNGLQTSREIFNYFSEKLDCVGKDNRNILVRVIKPEDEKTRDDIIFATNNQTTIPKSSLRVTDAIHLQIELYFKQRGLYYDRRKNYYKNQKKKACDIISVQFLAQCLISIFLGKPDYARARPSTLLVEEKHYNFLYKENNDLEVYYKVAKLGRNIRMMLRTSSDLTRSEINDLLFYIIYAVVAAKLKSKNISFNDFKALDIDGISNEEIISIKCLVHEIYNKLGGNGQVAKNRILVNSINLALMPQIENQ